MTNWDLTSIRPCCSTIKINKKEKTRCVNPTKPKRNNLSGGRENKKDLFSKAQLNLHKLLIISALKEEKKEGHFPYCEMEENQHRWTPFILFYITRSAAWWEYGGGGGGNHRLDRAQWKVRTPDDLGVRLLSLFTYSLTRKVDRHAYTQSKKRVVRGQRERERKGEGTIETIFFFSFFFLSRVKLLFNCPRCQGGWPENGRRNCSAMLERMTRGSMQPSFCWFRLNFSSFFFFFFLLPSS